MDKISGDLSGGRGECILLQIRFEVSYKIIFRDDKRGVESVELHDTLCMLLAKAQAILSTMFFFT